jgi:hypothetical protein
MQSPSPVTITSPASMRCRRCGLAVEGEMARIRAAAARHGVTVVDTFPHAFTTDARMWSIDRLHARPQGHARFAAAVAHALNLPGSDETWTHPLPLQPPRAPWQAAATELRWIAAFAGPWIHRRIRGPG